MRCPLRLKQPLLPPPPNYLALGDAAFEKSDYATAKAEYVKFVDASGNINDTADQKSANIRVLMRLGKCCRNLAQLAESRDWFGKVISTCPDLKGDCATAQYELGLSYGRDRKLNDAIAALEKVVTDYPTERPQGANALLKMAKIASGPKHRSFSTATFQRLIRDYPDQKEACKEGRWLLALALDDDTKINEAIAILRGMLESADYTADEKGDALVKIADVQARAARWSDAKATAQRVLSEHKDSPTQCRDAKWVMAQVSVETGDPTGAVALIDELRPGMSHDRQAPLTLWAGACYWIMGDKAKAEQYFTKVITDFSDVPDMADEAYFHRARLRIAKGDFAGATPDINKIKTEYLLRVVAGEWHYLQGDYGAASAEYEKSIASLPKSRIMPNEPIMAFNRLVACYTRLHQEDKAQQTRARLSQYEGGFK